VTCMAKLLHTAKQIQTSSITTSNQTKFLEMSS
jgi:hypothetical protein